MNPPSLSTAVAAPPSPGDPPRAGGGHVLLMDDDEALQEIVAAMLEHLGYAVTCAGDGDEAIRRFLEARAAGRPVSAVIVDLTVPGGMGGCETLERLRQLDAEVRVIVSSGYSNDPIMSEYATHGFVGVIAKPYQLAELGEAVRRALGGPA